MQRKRDIGLTIIAVGKALKAIVLVTVAVAALSMARHDPLREALHVTDVLRVDPENRFVHRLLESISGVSARKLDELGIGSFVYATLFAIEGTGLWLQKRWGEIVTVVITTSFVPLEVYEIVHRTAAGKIIALAINVAVVVYLVVRLLRQGERPAARERSSGEARFLA